MVSGSGLFSAGGWEEGKVATHCLRTNKTDLVLLYLALLNVFRKEEAISCTMHKWKVYISQCFIINL